MDKNLTFRYDRQGDILYINTCQPYSEQESEEIGDEIIARMNPKTGEIETIEVLFFSTRLLRTEMFAIPELKSYEEMAEFWDTHSLADYWDQTEAADFEFSPQARRRYMVSLDRNLLLRLQPVAHKRGLNIESIVNLLIEQRLAEIEV